MKAKRVFFIGIPVVILTIIGMNTIFDSLAVFLHGIGLNEELSRLLVTTIFYGAGSLGIYWLVMAFKRAYPKLGITQPETKTAFQIWCLLLTANPLVEFVFRKFGLENTFLWWVFVDHFDTTILFVVIVVYVVWQGYLRMDFVKAANPQQEEK
jgi:hypothetical protein